MTVRFEVEITIAAPPAVVFDLSLDIDAHRASMGRSNERAIGGVTTGQIALGEDVTWRATHFGIPFTMTSTITDLERPLRFVDQQMRGPFRSFRHEHLFRPTGSGTVMIDRIEFRAPFGPIGSIAERLLLGRYLQNLIETRNDYLKQQIEAEGVGWTGSSGTPTAGTPASTMPTRSPNTIRMPPGAPRPGGGPGGRVARLGGRADRRDVPDAR